MQWVGSWLAHRLRVFISGGVIHSWVPVFKLLGGRRLNGAKTSKINTMGIQRILGRRWLRPSRSFCGRPIEKPGGMPGQHLRPSPAFQKIDSFVGQVLGRSYTRPSTVWTLTSFFLLLRINRKQKVFPKRLALLEQRRNGMRAQLPSYAAVRYCVAWRVCIRPVAQRGRSGEAHDI
jgi:hypothetical protein